MTVDVAEIAPGIHRLLVPAVLEATDTDRYLDALAGLVARRELFGAVIGYPEGKPRKSRQSQQLETAWLRSHRHELARTCVGIAFVHAGGTLERTLQRLVVKGIATRFFGCPCDRFDVEPDAVAWLRRRLGGAT